MRARGYLAFAVGILLTVSVCVTVRDAQQQQILATFQRDADKIAYDTSMRLQAYFDVLYSVKGMYALEDSVNRSQFHRFIEQLSLPKRYPGFQAIQFVRLVPEAELDSFSAAVRQDASLAPQGYPQFLIHPASLREQHYVVEYNEPMAGNENAFGLDLSALAPHLAALELGRDSGDIIATEPIVLVQDASGEPGFVARVPVYRNGMPAVARAERRAALVGFVAVVFRMNGLMREVIETPQLEYLHVRITDGGYANAGGAAAPGIAGGAGADSVLFDSDGKVAASQEKKPVLAGLSFNTALAVGQRRWLLQFEGRGGARYSRDPLPVVMIGVAGFIISALIAALLLAAQRVIAAKHGLEYSLAELERQKNNVELARNDLSAVLATLNQAETNLVTSEKMASLGALVAGVAHELNTPIGNSLLTATALSDMVRDFQRRLLDDGGLKRSALETHLSDARTACDIMAGSLTRAADLITSFKQVAVDQSSGQRRRFMLNEVVHDVLLTYAAQMRRGNCQVEVDVPQGLEFDSYPGSLSQVLSNLIGNTLLHGFDGCDCGIVQLQARRLDDGNVQLLFRDNGVGMSAATLHKIFDPFFTTKMGQGGSGLGMNIVYNIVTGVLKGTIRVDSELGQGASVTLVLPMRVPASANDAAAAPVALAGA